jgi:hypothetical protein
MVFAVVGLAAGCEGQLGGDAGLVQSVVSKATDIAAQIGRPDGYGGSAMAGYYDHTPRMMGFVDSDDLATEDASLTIVLRNESAEEATFHLAYFASHMGLDEQSEEVVVAAGQEVEIELPCSEIVGMGSLNMPGGVGCHLAGGVEIDNTMAVPIFLGMDFACGEKQKWEFVLTPDADDLDEDGDIEELILLSDGFVGHMQIGGPFGHSHRGGMMGPHMMMRRSGTLVEVEAAISSRE